MIFGYYLWLLVTTSDYSLLPVIFHGFWRIYGDKSRKKSVCGQKPRGKSWLDRRFQTPRISGPQWTFFRFIAANPSINPHCWWDFGQNRGFPLTCDFWSLPVTFDHYLWLFVTTYDFSLLPVILQSTCDFWSLPMIFGYYPWFFWSKRPQTRDDYFWSLPVIFLFPSWFWRGHHGKSQTQDFAIYGANHPRQSTPCGCLGWKTYLGRCCLGRGHRRNSLNRPL